MTTPPTAPITTPDDMAKRRAWLGHFFASPADLPISLVKASHSHVRRAAARCGSIE
jgi:hypothetical protein